MPLILNIDEMLEGLSQVQHPQFDAYKAEVEALAGRLADAVALQFKLKVRSPAAFEGTAFAGTCASFEPTYPDQPIPPALRGYDDDGWNDDTIWPDEE